MGETGLTVCRKCGYSLDALPASDGLVKCPECALVQAPGPARRRPRFLVTLAAGVPCHTALMIAMRHQEGWGQVGLTLVGPPLVAVISMLVSAAAFVAVPGLRRHATGRAVFGFVLLGGLVNIALALGAAFLAVWLWPRPGC